MLADMTAVDPNETFPLFRMFIEFNHRVHRERRGKYIFHFEIWCI